MYKEGPNSVNSIHTNFQRKQGLWYSPLAEAQLIVYRVHDLRQGTKHKGTLNLTHMITQHCCMAE